MESIRLERFCGQAVTGEQLSEINVIIETFPKLSRPELANTICELFSWKRANGKLKTVADDWLEQFGRRPVLMETLVGGSRFKGAFYRAANFVCVGETTGRSRMDTDNIRQGMAVKQIYVYPFRPDSAKN
jgi:hypothetical protein